MEKNIDTIHELTLGVQKCYKRSSTILENDCGFEVYYNKGAITYVVLKNEDKFVDIMNKQLIDFTKTNVYSVNELPELTELGFKKGTSTSTEDNHIIQENLSKKRNAMIRRAKRFVQREGFEIAEISYQELNDLTDLWIEEKHKDPRVFKMTFSPNRYKNAVHFLNNKDYSFYNVKKDGKFIASVAFYNKDDVSYQLTYASDSTVDKVVNDQYELILWAAFADRFDNGARVISMGTSGGIKNLKNFKKKFHTNHQSCFSYTLKKEKEKPKETKPTDLNDWL